MTAGRPVLTGSELRGAPVGYDPVPVTGPVLAVSPPVGLSALASGRGDLAP